MFHWEHSGILSTFIKLLFFIKIFVLFIFEWPVYTGFTQNGAFCNTFDLHLATGTICRKILIVSLFEWAFYTGATVFHLNAN